MNRDMDLIRRIALAVANLPHGKILADMDGVDAPNFVLHVLWMREGGLIDAGDAGATLDSHLPQAAWINRLTWDGCEFVDAVRSDTLWNKAKETIIKPSLAFSFSVFRDWLKTEIAQGLPALGR